ncbi:MAG: ABC transporter ATP-binding protein [Janthinobacterium lividum]
MSENVIETRGLTRYFGKRCVVDALDLTVPRGCIFGFLGRNGAGKSTTIRMLLGLIAPTRGSASVLGHDSRALTPEVRARIGYLAEGHHVYGWMSVADCGHFQSAFYPNWNDRVFQSVLSHFGLKSTARAGDLSRGERAGLCLALTLAPQPELLILDDPALGLDPVARRGLLQSMIYLTRKADQTVFFSSHLLSDVERVADRIAVLDGSLLRADCSLETFRARVRQFVLTFPGTPPALPPLPGLLQTSHAGREVTLTLTCDADTERRLAALGASQIEAAPLGLEDAFVSYLSNRGEKSYFLDNMNEPSENGLKEETR